MKLRPASSGSLANRLPEVRPVRAAEASVPEDESGVAGAGVCRGDDGWSGEREVDDVNSGSFSYAHRPSSRCAEPGNCPSISAVPGTAGARMHLGPPGQAGGSRASDIRSVEPFRPLST
jgi:hypothetical protein